MYRMSSKIRTEKQTTVEVLSELKGEFNEEVKRRKREKAELVRTTKSDPLTDHNGIDD